MAVDEMKAHRVIGICGPVGVGRASLETELIRSKDVEIIVIGDSKLVSPVTFNEPEPIIFHNYRLGLNYIPDLPKHSHKRNYKFHR